MGTTANDLDSRSRGTIRGDRMTHSGLFFLAADSVRLKISLWGQRDRGEERQRDKEAERHRDRDSNSLHMRRRET